MGTGSICTMLESGGPLFYDRMVRDRRDCPEGYDYEPIHDKDLKSLRPKLLQCSDSHAFGAMDHQLVNTLGKSFLDGTRARETHTIHPGGYAVSVLERSRNGHIWWSCYCLGGFEVIFVNPQGPSPVDYLEERVATFMNLKGDTWDYVWDASRYYAQKTRPWRYLCEELPSYPEWSTSEWCGETPKTRNLPLRFR